MLVKSNLFVAWFLIAQIFFSDVLAGAGTIILSLLGMVTPLADTFGWLVGALILVAALLILRNVLGELPPGVGKPGVKGYKLGHALLLAGNWLAVGIYVVPLFIASLESHNLKVVLASFSIGFMYTSLGLFAFGVSLIYQSGLPSATTIKS
jgi:phosphoglycerol transferase MdoB-like AlkP superfamily enzyme